MQCKKTSWIKSLTKAIDFNDIPWILFESVTKRNLPNARDKKKLFTKCFSHFSKNRMVSFLTCLLNEREWIWSSGSKCEWNSSTTVSGTRKRYSIMRAKLFIALFVCFCLFSNEKFRWLKIRKSNTDDCLTYQLWIQWKHRPEIVYDH